MSYVLRKWISNLLIVEGRVDDAIRIAPRYAEEIRMIAAKDPSGNNKYVMWAAKNIESVTGDEILDVIRKFHKHAPNFPEGTPKDINQWDARDLISFFENYTPPLSRKEIKRDTKKLFDTGRYMLLSPKSKAASCFYGASTRWCISATEANRFQRYDEAGHKFYFIIDRQGENQSNFSRLALQVNEGTVRNLWLANNDKVKPEMLPLYIEPDFFHPLATAISRHSSIPIDMIGGGNLRHKDISLSNLEAFLHQGPSAINQTWIQEMLAANKDGVEIFTRYSGQDENAKITPKMLKRLIEYATNVFYLESVPDAETFAYVLQLLISHPSVPSAECASMIVKTSELGNELGPYAARFFTFLTRTLLKKNDVNGRLIFQVANGIREERFYSGVFFEIIRNENSMLLDFIVRNGVHWHTEKVVALLDAILGDIDKSSSESFEKSALAYAHYVYDKYTDERVRSRAGSIIRIAAQ